MKTEIYDGLKLVGIIDEDFGKKPECINHKVVRKNGITGDPYQVHVICTKCGEEATRNLITNETR